MTGLGLVSDPKQSSSYTFSFFSFCKQNPGHIWLYESSFSLLSFRWCFDRLASRELLKFLCQEGLHSKLKKWEQTLKMVHAVLGDAEEKQLTDRAVKMWLDDLRDLAYDVEDILDEFATEALSRKLKMQQHDQASTSTSKVRKLIPARLGNLYPSAVKFSAHMRSQLEIVVGGESGVHEAEQQQRHAVSAVLEYVDSYV